MGSCCSKTGSIGVKETIASSTKNYGLLVSENVGATSSVEGIQDNDEAFSQGNDVTSANLHIQMPRDLSTQESESIDTYNKINNSAARSTLIFPSYSGYRNEDKFGIPKKSPGSDRAPTAFVSPFLIDSPSPIHSKSAVDYVTQKYSPLMTSRYSPMMTPNLARRNKRGAFDNHVTRRGSIESGGFDSDLESDSDEVTTMQHRVSDPQINVVQDSPQLTRGDVATNTTTQTDATSACDQNFIETVDVCIGTDSDDICRSRQTVQVQVDVATKKKTSSVGMGTDPEPQVIATKSSKTTTTSTSVGTETLKPENTNTKNNANTQSESFVKMVDVCVGTDNDDFYRSKKTTKVQVEPNKKKIKKSSMATATDPAIASFSIPQTEKLSQTPKKKPQPKITPEIIEVQTPKPQRRSPTPSRASSSSQAAVKPEPHPIIETLENAFFRFARYGEINSEGREMNNKNWAKLCRDCEFIDNKSVLVGDVDVIFSRHKPKGYRLVDFEMFANCLNEIADRKFSHKIKDEWTRREIIYHRVIGKAPELIGVTGTSKTGNVNRMTDHTLYPASHKMRFDEDGHGLGIEDKFEIQDSQLGYVQGYKDRDTYEAKLSGSPRVKPRSSASPDKLPISDSPALSRPRSSGSNRSRNSENQF